jgi:hypothetical protein
MTSPPPSGKVVQLRELLRERFPEAHARRAEPDGADEPLGIAVLDRLAIAERGSITEVVSETPGRGAGLLLYEVIRDSAAQSRPLALIDGRDTFDPQSQPPGACESLLWIRCHAAKDAVRAADLLLRDGNLSLLLIDLEQNPSRELRRIPSSSWHRLRMLTEKAGCVCLAFTPMRLIPSAGTRVHFTSAYALDALDTPREILAGNLQFHISGKAAKDTPLKEQLKEPLAK